MDTVTNQVIKYCKEQIALYPELQMEIIEIFRLYLAEAGEEGSSDEHEAELFYSDVDTTIHEYKKKNQLL